jgi:hypothetical protein
LWYGGGCPQGWTLTEFCLLLTGTHAGKSVPPASAGSSTVAISTKESEAACAGSNRISPACAKKLAADGHTARVLINHRGMGFMLTTTHIHG